MCIDLTIGAIVVNVLLFLDNYILQYYTDTQCSQRHFCMSNIDVFSVVNSDVWLHNTFIYVNISDAAFRKSVINIFNNTNSIHLRNHW